MTTTIELLDGNVHTLFDTDDFKYLVGKYMGDEAERYYTSAIRELEEDADYNTQKVNCDLESHEGTLEENTVCFQDILDVTKAIENELESSKRINRRSLLKMIQSINRLINNQI